MGYDINFSDDILSLSMQKYAIPVWVDIPFRNIPALLPEKREIFDEVCKKMVEKRRIVEQEETERKCKNLSIVKFIKRFIKCCLPYGIIRLLRST